MALKFPYTKKQFVDKLREAARFYWDTRLAQAVQQRKKGTMDAGHRGQVTAGKHLDGFANLVREVGRAAGFKEAEISFNMAVPIPGYYRPQKSWDVVFLRQGALVAAVELKSQGGSFGNNFNNRSEEVVGVSKDFWTAYRERAFGVCAPPWLGYFFFLEDTEDSKRPVALMRGPLPPQKIFEGTSYQRRYEILCERLVLERDFTSTALVVSSKGRKDVRDGGANVTAFAFFKSLFQHLASRG